MSRIYQPISYKKVMNSNHTPLGSLENHYSNNDVKTQLLNVIERKFE